MVSVVGLILVGFGAHNLGPAEPALAVTVALAMFAVAMVVALIGLRASYPHDRLGACNMVTQLRAVAASILTVPVVAPDTMAQSAPSVFAIAVGALALDGLDGVLARRARLTSAFGARFDMEVDAALAAILALILIRADGIDGAVALASLLVLGGARYAFVIAACVLPWLNRALPPRRSRSVICVVQIATLAGLLLPWVADNVAQMALPIAAGVLIWSFARDILWLFGRRSRAGT